MYGTRNLPRYFKYAYILLSIKARNLKIRKQLMLSDINHEKVSDISINKVNKPKFIFVETDIPMESTSGLQSRAFQICKYAKQKGYDVYWLSLNDATTTLFWTGMSVIEFDEICNRFKKEIGEIIIGESELKKWNSASQNLVSYFWISRVATGTQFFEYLKNLYFQTNKTKIILDTADLAYVRYAREFHKVKNHDLLSDVIKDVAEYRKLLTISHIVIHPTKEELERSEYDFEIQVNSNLEKVVLGHLSNFKNCKASLINGHNSKNFLFFGNFAHTPNQEAVEWFLANWQFFLQKDRNFVLHLIGRFLPESIQLKLKEQQNIIYHDFLPDENLKEIALNCRAFLAPLAFGAGIKTKVLDSMLIGLPVIGSSIAWESIPLVQGKNGFLADALDEYFHAIEQLQNPVLWQDMQETAKLNADTLTNFNLDKIIR